MNKGILWTIIILILLILVVGIFFVFRGSSDTNNNQISGLQANVENNIDTSSIDSQTTEELIDNTLVDDTDDIILEEVL